MEFKSGKTKIKIVEPDPMTEEEVKKRWNEVMRVAWHIWNDLSREEKIQINKEVEESGRQHG